jgi:hypothetical protein
LPTPVIDDRQDPKWAPIGQGIMHKIHAPTLPRSRWHGSRAMATCQSGKPADNF